MSLPHELVAFSVLSLRPMSSFLQADSVNIFQPLFDARDNSTSMTPAASYSGTSRNLSVHVPLAIDAASGEDTALNPAADSDGLRLGCKHHHPKPLEIMWLYLRNRRQRSDSIYSENGQRRRSARIEWEESGEGYAASEGENHLANASEDEPSSHERLRLFHSPVFLGLQHSSNSRPAAVLQQTVQRQSASSLIGA